MAHPYDEHRAYKVERERVPRMTKGYEGEHADAEEDRSMIKRMVKPSAMKGYAAGGAVSKPGVFKPTYAKRDGQAVEGGEAKERLDRPGRAMRAKGGRTKSKGTHVNVIVAPQGGDKAPLPVTPPPGPAAAPPGAPPMMPRPPVPPMAGPGVGAPGPIRRAGGRTYASGGRIADGPAWKEGIRSGTPVQNNPAGKNDQRDVSRGKPVTYATGGPIYSPEKGGMAPRLPGGSGGGEARLAKAKLAKRGGYGKR